MRPGAALRAFLTASLVFLSSAFAESPALRVDAGRALLEEARQASSLGDWGNAAAFLDEAAIQDPGSSDILYLRALASVRLAKPYAAALGDLNAALAASRFQVYAKREVRILKAELLIRERRWAEALDALGGPGGGNAADPAYSLARAKALIGSGADRAFLAEVSEGLRRFPTTAPFPGSSSPTPAGCPSRMPIPPPGR